MAKLRNLRDVPPGGWFYLERETGQRFSSDDYDTLIAEVKRHREYKGLDVSDVGRLVQEQICIGLSEKECKAYPGEDYKPVSNLTQSLTTDMAVSVNKAVTKFLLSGAEFEAREEAARRAEICRKCPFNVPASNCSCHVVYRALALTIPKDRRHNDISVCMCCGCSLPVKVNMPAAVLRESVNPKAVFPAWCWQREIAGTH